MNEGQLEALLHRERLQAFFAHQQYLDLWERNLQLREYVLELQAKLNCAEVDYIALPPPEEPPTFSFMAELTNKPFHYEITTTKIEA